MKVSQKLIIDIKNIIYFSFRYYKCMSYYQWRYIQKCITAIIFSYCITWNFTVYNFCKNACHLSSDI
ncbi:hypothetical protein MYP_2191 [Sporocytophaga myxococcoides]|uniref:Uncharacterized protein n=1 Tax=Sporocytophaga myxococcoides TaxID=153721 RepID=A0A098LFT5_9BACT|nr:hypothetical protein MYP_2191 [Sporocytophaga myxococcoides]